MKYLRLSPEYGCSPLWVSSDGVFYDNLEIAASPFNALLKSKLFTWASTFEETLNHDYPPDSGFKSLKEEEHFEQTGVEIWADITQSCPDLFNKVFFKSYRLQKLYSNFEEYQKDINNLK